MHRRDIFDNGRRRAQYFLRLHALLQDRRQRGIRHDWARNFKRVMHWPQRERVNRIDGRQAILVLREGAGLGPEHFREETLSELLRAALVDIVSALDRYCHELVVSRIVKALGRSEKSINRELRQLYIPVLAAKAAVRHAGIRRGKGGRVRTRPMTIIRHAVQDILYRESYQAPEDIRRALRMVDIEDLWPRCAEQMHIQQADLIRELGRIVDRRNKIVHEGDVIRRRKGGRLILHTITRRQVRADIEFIVHLVSAMETQAS